MEKSKPLSLKDRVDAFRPYQIQLKQTADRFYHSEAYKHRIPDVDLGRRHILRMQQEDSVVMPGKSFDQLIRLLGIPTDDPFVRGYLKTISALNERELNYLSLTPKALRLFMDLMEMYENQFMYGTVGDFAKLFDEHAEIVADTFHARRESMRRLNDELVQAHILDLLLDIDALKQKYSANMNDSHSVKMQHVTRIDELSEQLCALNGMNEKSIAEHIGKMSTTYLRRKHPSTISRTSVSNLEEIIEALESMVSLAGMGTTDELPAIQTPRPSKEAPKATVERENSTDDTNSDISATSGMLNPLATVDKLSIDASEDVAYTATSILQSGARMLEAAGKGYEFPHELQAKLINISRLIKRIALQGKREEEITEGTPMSSQALAGLTRT